MRSSTSNNFILNFHDAVIYRSDLDIVKSPSAWLNDACVNFYLARLEASISRNSATNLKFMDPSVLSFFMHQWDVDDDDNDDDDVLGLLSPGNYSKQFCFLPINDNFVSQRWSTPGGGSHWSLLLMVQVQVPTVVGFWHFDSSEGSGNLRAATAVAQKIQRVIMSHSIQSTNKSSQQVMLPVQQCSVPQQQNGYDCGLHTLATAEAIARACCTTEDLAFDTTAFEAIVKRSVATSPSYFNKMRQTIVQDIENLASAAVATARHAS